jgi:hypothetical protein
MLMPLSLGGSAVAPSPRRNPRWIRIWREEGRGGGSGGPENKEGRGDDGRPGGVLEKDRERESEGGAREGGSERRWCDRREWKARVRADEVGCFVLRDGEGGGGE